MYSYTRNAQVFFEVIQHHSGAFTANCLNAEIATRGGSLQELPDKITEALDVYFAGKPRPMDKNIHLLLYKEA